MEGKVAEGLMRSMYALDINEKTIRQIKVRTDQAPSPVLRLNVTHF